MRKKQIVKRVSYISCIILILINITSCNTSNNDLINKIKGKEKIYGSSIDKTAIKTTKKVDKKSNNLE